MMGQTTVLCYVNSFVISIRPLAYWPTHHLDGHIPMKSPQNCQPPVATLPFVVVRACVVVASVREGLNRQSRVTHTPPPLAATAACVSHSALGKEL